MEWHGHKSQDRMHPHYIPPKSWRLMLFVWLYCMCKPCKPRNIEFTEKNSIVIANKWFLKSCVTIERNWGLLQLLQCTPSTLCQSFELLDTNTTHQKHIFAVTTDLTFHSIDVLLSSLFGFLDSFLIPGEWLTVLIRLEWRSFVLVKLQFQFCECTTWTGSIWNTKQYCGCNRSDAWNSSHPFAKTNRFD